MRGMNDEEAPRFGGWSSALRLSLPVSTDKFPRFCISYGFIPTEQVSAKESNQTGM